MRPLKSTSKRCVLASSLLGAALGPCIARAALGEPTSSVQSNVARLHGSISVVEHANYRAHDIQLPSGTRVREFTGLDGRVFAVSWSGPTIPNLREILGRYFDSYMTAATTIHAGHHRLQLHRDDVVIEAGGHMRAFSGIAYLPPAVPNGLNVGALR